ncbi:ABC transporter ATP-binding protein [Acidiphilium sp. PA]|uniref:ABC transporter ATP-binding protein n=1 Tax=Acidiphilium sp. PA TaxID=2871705 RepID=UPI0022437225|nr:ABC transporter ATP-binding protein [Acidiphilium sp. PA]MCW8309404.1 ABC transporter ATP-binding protein [Acidiphilium sp. PA]
MIDLRNVSKSYRTDDGGHRVILRNVDTIFPTGRNVGILGVNGSGKSTLVRMLSGVEMPDGGRIVRAGDVSFPLGFGGTFHPNLSGVENVKFLARVYGADPKEAVEYVEGFAELGSYFRMPVSTYSSGMTARLAFGACLAIEFDTYLIDEVTAVGDAAFREKCLHAFEDRMSNSNVVIVSHDETTIRRWCDMGAVLADGEIIMFDAIEDALETHRNRMQHMIERAS